MATINHQRGITLIELVVVAGLLSVISVGLIGVFISTIRGTNNARVQAEVKSQGDFAIASMERTIRNAFEITCNGSQLTYSVRDTDGTPISKGYQKNDTTLVDATNKKLLGNTVEVTDLTFSCPTNSNSVTIMMTLKASGDYGDATYQTFDTTIALRNKP